MIWISPSVILELGTLMTHVHAGSRCRCCRPLPDPNSERLLDSELSGYGMAMGESDGEHNSDNCQRTNVILTLDFMARHSADLPFFARFHVQKPFKGHCKGQGGLPKAPLDSVLFGQKREKKKRMWHKRLSLLLRCGDRARRPKRHFG